MVRERQRITWGQRGLLIGLGLFLLLGVELATRLVGFGGTPPLLLPFLTEPEVLMEVNPDLAAPFFARRAPDGSETVGAHRRELVRRPKRGNTIRVLFLGASSVEGFPLPRNLTSARFLEEMLDRSIPGRDVEVLNLGVTAVASFPVRVIGERAIAELEPDLVLVYAGHNELFGASGVASRQFLGRRVSTMRGLYALRRTGLGQLLQGLLQPAPETHAEQRRNLIEMMAGVDLVEPGGPLHDAALRSLGQNLEALVRAARSHDVPIVLSTLVSLERGLHPIAPWTDLAEDRRGERDRRLEALRDRIEDAPADVLPQLEALAAKDPRHGGIHYSIAEVLEALGRDEEATQAYGRARDLDGMPWRAPGDRNREIAALADRLGVALADPARAFEAQAEGAPDWELFYDHVHPTLQGQALVARSFADRIAEDGLLPVSPSDLGRLPEWTTIARDLGAHPLEGYLALHKMKTLFETPPIGTHNPGIPRRLRRVLYGQSRGWEEIDQSAVDLWERMSLRAGFTVGISYPAARAALAASAPEWARMYARAAIANAYPWSDQRCAARLALVEAQIEDSATFDAAAFDRELEEALTELDQVLTTPNQPTPLLAAVEARLRALAGDDDPALWQRSAELAKGAPDWVGAYLGTLPPRELYLALAAFRERASRPAAPGDG